MLAFPPHLHGFPIIQHRDKLSCTRTPCQRHSGLAYRRPLESDGRCSLPSFSAYERAECATSAALNVPASP